MDKAMRSLGISVLSLILTTIVVANAYYQKKQFYPSVVYITKSNPSMAVIYIQAFICVLLLGKIMRKIFFGQLRSAEFEHLMERSWYAITETCLAFTVFRDDFNPKFVALFTLLLFLKSFHWLAEDRVDYNLSLKRIFDWGQASVIIGQQDANRSGAVFPCVLSAPFRIKMCECSRQRYLRVTVYILTLCQIVVGVIHLLQGSVHASQFLVIVGISELIMASILTFGIIKNNEHCVMIYLILGVFGVITLTLRVFFLIVSDGAGEPDEVIIFIILALILSWSTQYSIYLFYRDMVFTNRTMAALSGNVTVGSETIVYSDYSEFNVHDKELPPENTAV